MSTHILIIGGNAQAKSLALSLAKKKFNVTVVNKDFTLCKTLAETKGINVIFGDGSKPFILKEAQAEKHDIAIALGDHDADNLIICEICKKQFHVGKTIALVNDARKTAFFYSMGIDRVVCAISAINVIIEQSALASELTTIIPTGEGRVRIVEVLVAPNSPVINKALKDIRLPEQAIIASILREDSSIIPHGNTQIMANDMLLLITSDSDQDEAFHVITGK